MENEFFFPPYKGELYGKPEGFFNEVRVMAIGNSHHCDTKFDHYHRCCEQCENYIPSCNNFTMDTSQYPYRRNNNGGYESGKANMAAGDICEYLLVYDGNGGEYNAYCLNFRT